MKTQSRRGAYRKVGNELLKIAREKVASSDMQNAGKALSTEDLFQHIWGRDENAETKIVWMYICFLRTKLRAINADIVISGEENGSYLLREDKP